MSRLNLPPLPEATLGTIPATTTTIDCFLPVLQTDVLSCGPTGAGVSGLGESHGISHGCHAHRRHKRKHKREEKGEDSDEYCQPKRFLSEEVMSACLQQLNLTSSPRPVPASDLNSNASSSCVLSNELSIRTVAACSGSLDQRGTRTRPSPMEASSSSECYKRKSDPKSLASAHPLKLRCSNGMSGDGGGSGSKHLSHLAPGVQIK